MKTHWHRRNADRGFTLVELLIVIVIIAILAGLLFPAITAAFDAAQSLECRNNLKEIAQAVLRYASENDGVIVPAYDEEAGLRWANILVMRGYVKATNLVAKPNEDPLEKRSILLCPSTLSVKNTTPPPPVSPFADEAQGWVGLGKNDTHEVACSYYWNGCTDDTLTSYWRQFPSLKIPKNQTNKRQYLHYLTEISQRTSFVMAMDGIFMDALDAPNADPAAEKKNRGRIAARHRGKYGRLSRTNIVFYDGHAEEYEWTLDYKDTPPWLKDPLWAVTELHATSNRLTSGALIFRLDDQTPVSP
jgi:prepilin-type N-terminal cleavage/methylation domain-containing protein/prepilin-type processing-associated H-X9-DG protein